MDIAKTQQKININSTSTSKAYSSQNTSDKPFAEELKDAKNAQETDAAKKVESIIQAEKCRVDRIEDFDLNTKEELLHELLTVDLKNYKK